MDLTIYAAASLEMQKDNHASVPDMMESAGFVHSQPPAKKETAGFLKTITKTKMKNCNPTFVDLYSE